MNVDISETIKDRELGSQIYIPYPCTQGKFVTRVRHAQSNAHKLPKSVAPTIFFC